MTTTNQTEAKCPECGKSDFHDLKCSHHFVSDTSLLRPVSPVSGFAAIVRQSLEPIKGMVPDEVYRETFIRVLAIYTSAKALNRAAPVTPAALPCRSCGNIRFHAETCEFVPFCLSAYDSLPVHDSERVVDSHSDIREVAAPTEVPPIDRYTLGDAIRIAFLKYGRDSWCLIADDVIATLGLNVRADTVDREEWREMESAPKDGTAIFAYTPDRSGYVASQQFDIIHWSGWGGGVWENVSGYKPTCTFTRWQSLPAPPKEKS